MTTEAQKAEVIAKIDTHLSAIVQKAIDTNHEKLEQIKARRTDLLAHAASKPASFYGQDKFVSNGTLSVGDALRALAKDYTGA